MKGLKRGRDVEDEKEANIDLDDKFSRSDDFDGANTEVKRVKLG